MLRLHQPFYPFAVQHWPRRLCQRPLEPRAGCERDRCESLTSHCRALRSVTLGTSVCCIRIRDSAAAAP